ELDVDAARVVRTERHVLLLVRLEPAEFHFQGVGAGKDAGEEVLTTVVTRHRVRRLRAYIRQRYAGTGENAAARVLDGATDHRGRRPLASRCRWEQQQCAKNCGGPDRGAACAFCACSQHGSPLMTDGHHPHTWRRNFHHFMYSAYS